MSEKNDKIDYRKLLKLSIRTQFEAYGKCGFIEDDLSEADKDAIALIYDELEKEGVIGDSGEGCCDCPHCIAEAAAKNKN